MSKVFEDFLSSLKSTGSERTAKTYDSLLSSFYSWLDEKGISVKEFEREDVRDFLEQIRWANSSKNTFLQALKSWASYYEDKIPVGKTLEEMQTARQQEKRLRSLQKMRNYKTENNEPEVVEPEKLQLLLETSSPKKGCLFYFYFYTGMRLGEIHRIEDIDWEYEEGGQGVLTVLTEKRESNSTRKIPFSANAGAVIKKIFDNNWHEFNVETIGGYFREKKPVFDDINFSSHCGRRTFRTYMKKMDTEKVVVKKLLGHKLGDVTDSSYLKVDFGDLTKAMRENHYFNLIDVPYRRLL